GLPGSVVSPGGRMLYVPARFSIFDTIVGYDFSQSFVSDTVYAAMGSLEPVTATPRLIADTQNAGVVMMAGVRVNETALQELPATNPSLVANTTALQSYLTDRCYALGILTISIRD